MKKPRDSLATETRTTTQLDRFENFLRLSMSGRRYETLTKLVGVTRHFGLAEVPVLVKVNHETCDTKVLPGVEPAFLKRERRFNSDKNKYNFEHLRSEEKLKTIRFSKKYVSW